MILLGNQFKMLRNFPRNPDDDVSFMTFIHLCTIVPGMFDVLRCDDLDEIDEKGRIQKNDTNKKN